MDENFSLIVLREARKKQQNMFHFVNLWTVYFSIFELKVINFLSFVVMSKSPYKQTIKYNISVYKECRQITLILTVFARTIRASTTKWDLEALVNDWSKQSLANPGKTSNTKSVVNWYLSH